MDNCGKASRLETRSPRLSSHWFQRCLSTVVLVLLEGEIYGFRANEPCQCLFFRGYCRMKKSRMVYYLRIMNIVSEQVGNP